jgi:hypothetical protein
LQKTAPFKEALYEEFYFFQLLAIRITNVNLQDKSLRVKAFAQA